MLCDSWARLAVLALLTSAAIARSQQPAAPAVAPATESPATETPVNKELIEAAHKLTTEGAAKYNFTLEDGSQAKMLPEPVLRWSNPSVGEIHGNVFLWTADDRPAVVGSFYKWFTPHTHLTHEFHSLAEQPLVAKTGERQVWAASSAGVKFAPLPGAPAPAASAAQRLLQMKRLARDFAATKHERDGARQELRLLPQPI